MPVVSPAESAERPRRLARLDSLIEHELGELWPRLVELPPGTLASVSRVVVSADLSTARVAVSILPFSRRQEVLAELARYLPELQLAINRRLRLYHVPRLALALDETEERAGRIESLLDSERRE